MRPDVSDYVRVSKLTFGGVSIIAIGDLFQLQPVFDGYVFNDIQNSEYSILSPNLWKNILQCTNLKK